MQIKYQDQGYAVMDGPSLLDQIQNKSVPNLDLLIRESIQNSLDAAKPRVEKVEVRYNTGSFSSESLSRHFDGISRYLVKAFPGKRSFISITDTGTTGLTGPVSLSLVRDNQYGSLQKLIYQICKPKTEKDAGGSWGIGKTVYFRIGCGLVIYYSRIFNEETGRFEERMAATLAEGKGKDQLLKDDPQKCGLAWWGEKDETLESGNGTIPLVDKPEIYEILDVFSIPRFEGSQTGTVIIIPYINEQALLTQTRSEHETEEGQGKFTPNPWWKDSLEDYLNVGVQKWYCPRLDNKSFQGPYLEVWINDKKLRKNSFLPLFRLIQDLYNSSPDEPGSYHGQQIHSDSVVLRRVFSKAGQGKISAGTFSHLGATKEDMGMNPPENELSPYYAIDMEDEDDGSNKPIYACVRKPGMIISYEIASAPRSGNGDSQKLFAVGVFRANSDIQLVDSLTTDDIHTLEDYLRACENADHMKWEDTSINSGQKPRIIAKIRDKIKKTFNTTYMVTAEKVTQKRNVPLSIRLGQKLLPPEGLGYFDDRTGGGHGEGGKGGDGTSSTDNSPKPSVTRSGLRLEKIGNPVFSQVEVSLPVRLHFGKEKTGILYIQVNTENGKMNSDKWFEETGSECPVYFNSMTVTQIGKETSDKKRRIKKKGEGEINQTIDFSIDEKWIQETHFKVLHYNSGHRADCIQITVPSNKSYFLEGWINYSVNGFQGLLGFEKAGQKKKEGDKEE